jgi:hypothetical protein
LALKKLPTVILRAGEDRRVRAGHPWAFSNEILMDADAKAIPVGSLATLRAPGGEALALVTFNPHSLIAARVLSTNPEAHVDALFIGRRLTQAAALRDRLVGVERGLDHDLGFGWHLERHRLAGDQLDLLASEEAGELILRQRVGHRRHRRQDRAGIGADHDSRRQRLALAGLLPALVMLRAAAMLQPAHQGRVPARHLQAIDAEVETVLLVAFGVGPLCHHQRPRDQRRRLARPAGLDRQFPEVDVVAGEHDLLAGRAGHEHRRDGLGDRLLPGRPDGLERGRVHADAVDLGVGGQRAHDDVDVVAASAAVDHVREQEGLARVLRDAAAELPAHQRVQLGVLVYLRVDAVEQPRPVQGLQVLGQVGVLPGHLAEIGRAHV